jgi:hypothetical protein
MSEMRVMGGGHAFPKTSNVEWIGPKPVYHFVYKLRQSRNRKELWKGLPPKSLVLFKQQEGLGPSGDPGKRGDAETVKDISAIARQIAGLKGFYKEHNDSSVHIDLREQCWIILELDRKTNWRFVTTHAAITTKELEPEAIQDGKALLGVDGKKLQGFNADLHYVFATADGVKIESDPDKFPRDAKGNVADCHIVFFRMTHRGEKDACGMNFAVELFGSRLGGDPQGVALSTIPLIIDPQVPDEPPGGGG